MWVTGDLLLMNRMWQKEYYVASKTIIKRIQLPPGTLSEMLTLREASYHATRTLKLCGEVHVERN